MNPRLLLLSVLAAALAGCANPRDTVVFVTKTSVGIDFDSTPPSASFAYDRTEGYYGPKFNDGSAPPVAGSFFTSGGLFDRKIKQLYSTGAAANTVTGGAAKLPAPPAYSGDPRPMFFGTSTVFGLKLGFNSVGVDALTFGFKRKEASIIPLTVVAAAPGTTAMSPAYHFPSVLASLDTDFAAMTATSTTIGTHQYFATGVAADNLATLDSIKGSFIRDATGSLAQYRRDERLQAATLLDTLTCLAELRDDRLPSVWKNAEDLKLFPSDAVYAALRTQPAAQARFTYTRYVTIVNADSPMHTGLLAGHRAHVCALRG